MHACSINLHHIVIASMTHLRKLSLHYCTIVVSKEIVHTNIEELHIFGLWDMYDNDGHEIPNNKKSEVYVWIAECCPKVKVCLMRDCTIISCTTPILMVQQWRLLEKWEVSTPRDLDRVESNIDLNHFNQQTSTMTKANLQSIILDCDDFSCENVKYFLDILLTCCNIAELKSLVLYINDWPIEYTQRLLQSIANMHKMKHLTFRLEESNNMTSSPLVDAVWNYCHALESLQLLGPLDSAEDLMLFQAIAKPNHFHLAHLTSLQLFGMDLSDESINILCNSVYAKQLTSLCLNEIRGLSCEAYQQVFSSFNKLQCFELFFHRRTIIGNDEKQQKQNYKKLFPLLDTLFDGNFAFVNTLQTLTVRASCFNTNKKEYNQLKEENIA